MLNCLDECSLSEIILQVNFQSNLFLIAMTLFTFHDIFMSQRASYVNRIKIYSILLLIYVTMINFIYIYIASEDAHVSYVKFR